MFPSEATNGRQWASDHLDLLGEMDEEYRVSDGPRRSGGPGVDDATTCGDAEVACSQAPTLKISPETIASLPGGRRVGVVTADEHQVVLAFVGGDPKWVGGRVLRCGESVQRDGVTLTYLGATFCPRAEDWVAEVRYEAPDEPASVLGFVSRLTGW